MFACRNVIHAMQYGYLPVLLRTHHSYPSVSEIKIQLGHCCTNTVWIEELCDFVTFVETALKQMAQAISSLLKVSQSSKGSLLRLGKKKKAQIHEQIIATKKKKSAFQSQSSLISF